MLEAVFVTNLHGKGKFEELGTGKSQATPSVITPPILELKPLSSYLKYAFLGSNSTLLVILSAPLKEFEEEKLLRVLRKHKTVDWIFKIHSKLGF